MNEQATGQSAVPERVSWRGGLIVAAGYAAGIAHIWFAVIGRAPMIGWSELGAAHLGPTWGLKVLLTVTPHEPDPRLWWVSVFLIWLGIACALLGLISRYWRTPRTWAAVMSAIGIYGWLWTGIIGRLVDLSPA